MVPKDYYKILEIPPSATLAEIKKSFRRLALIYHPDKNFGSSLHEARFKEIKEAYEVLSDTRQRQEYNSKRSAQPRADQKTSYRQPSPRAILEQTIAFRKKITALDPERMNKRAVYHHLQQLLAIQNILILKHSHDQQTTRRFIDEIIVCSQFLPFPKVEKICLQLTELAGTDNEIYRKIFQFSRQSRLHSYWDKYKLLIAVVVALLLCLLIYLLSANF